MDALEQMAVLDQTAVEPDIQADEAPDDRPDTRNRRALSIEEMRSKLGVAAAASPQRPAFDLSSRPRIIRRRDDAACEAGFGMALA